jgi:predicted nucleic acid-binding protein
MIVLFDTNVLLDVLARREPFYAAAAAVWSLAEAHKIEGVVSAISFNNAFYIVRKANGRDRALASLRVVRGRFRAVPLDVGIVDDALASGLTDFEDAIQYASAVRAGADCIVTRDPAGFPDAGIAILSPEVLASTLTALPDDSAPGPRP